MESEKIRQRIDALLSKTVENGATEEEEMSAMAKAMELISKYQVDMTKESAKKQGIKMDKIAFDLPLAQFAGFELLPAVGKAADVRGFKRGDGSFYFVGLEEDVAFAKWLFNNLVIHSVRSVNEWWRSPENYLPCSKITAGQRVRIKQSYIKGFALRCYQRAKEEKKKIESNGRSLVVVKSEAIDEFMTSNNIAPKEKKDRRGYVETALNSGYQKGAEAQLRKVEQVT